MLPAARAEIFAQALTRARIEDAHVQVVLLHRDALSDPHLRHAGIRGLHFHAAIEVHTARAEAIIAKRFQWERKQMWAPSAKIALPWRFVVP